VYKWHEIITELSMSGLLSNENFVLISQALDTSRSGNNYLFMFYKTRAGVISNIALSLSISLLFSSGALTQLPKDKLCNIPLTAG